MRPAQRLAIKYVRTKFKLLSRMSAKLAARKAFQLFCTPQYRNRKKLPPLFEQSEKLQFSFEGNTVRGYRWNNGAPNKALILHGFESSVVNFEKYVKALTGKGYGVLAFDAPAHGRSTGKTINVLVYKQLILHILETYGPVDAFIAHSFGGLSLCLALEEWPHTFATRLALIAPAVETTTAIDHFFRFLKLDATVRPPFNAIIQEMSSHPPEWFSIARAAHNIHASVLFLQDRDDETTPLSDVQPIMAKNPPNFRFVISSGLGHRRIYRDNTSLNTIIDFL